MDWDDVAKSVIPLNKKGQSVVKTFLVLNIIYVVAQVFTVLKNPNKILKNLNGIPFTVIQIMGIFLRLENQNFPTGLSLVNYILSQDDKSK